MPPLTPQSPAREEPWAYFTDEETEAPSLRVLQALGTQGSTSR